MGRKKRAVDVKLNGRKALRRKIRRDVDRYLYAGRGDCVRPHETSELTSCIMSHVDEALKAKKTGSKTKGGS